MTTENEPPKGSNAGRNQPGVNQMPVADLIRNWANRQLRPGQKYRRQELIDMFGENHPEIPLRNVNTYLGAIMCVNARGRRGFPNVVPGAGYDLFYRVARGQYRLYDPQEDPTPIYHANFQLDGNNENDEELPEQAPVENNLEFSREKDLQKYLSQNLDQIETD